MVAAFERTEKRVEASDLLHIPLWKFCSDEAMMALTCSRGVESIVVINCSVAGLVIWIRCGVGD